MNKQTALISIITMIFVNFTTEVLKYTLPPKPSSQVQVQVALDEESNLRLKHLGETKNIVAEQTTVVPAAPMVQQPVEVVKTRRHVPTKKVAQPRLKAKPKTAFVKPKTVFKVGQFQVETHRSDFKN